MEKCRWRYWEKEDGLAARVFFIILLAGYAALTFFLFYRQAIEYQGIYYSDMKAYILETQGLNSGYEFPYPIFFWLSGIWLFFLNPGNAVALTTMLLNLASVVLLKYYFNRDLKASFAGKQIKWNIWLDGAVTLLVFAVFFLSMIYSPRGTTFLGFDYTYRCMGIYTPNPYWNATYLAVRPFAIVSFYLAVRILGHYEKELRFGECLAFGMLLLAATMTKPSFTFILVPAFGLVMLYRLVRSRFANWRNTLLLGCFFLPAGAALLYQFFGVFSGQNVLGEETGIGFEIGKAWHMYSGNIPLSMLMGLAFPLCVLLFNFKELKRDGSYRLAWQVTVVGLLTFLCLYEKGFRFSHMNFSWGYMHGMFFIYGISVCRMVKNTIEWKKKGQKLFLLPEWGAFAVHLICGINYFVYIMQGNNTGWF